VDILENELRLNLRLENLKNILNSKSDWNLRAAFESIDVI